ncbi:gametocyte-specific factor 1 isoform X2 [Vanacampus margaritifer]
MATIRFGSSTAPSLLSRFSERTLVVKQVGNDHLDPDRLCQCPLDKSHQIRACRLAYHLLKCKKNHPQLAKELKTCPFNACHLVPKSELANHTETCPNRIAVGTKDGGAEGWRKCEVPVTSQFTPAATEDWDNEVDEAAVPFVWGKSTIQAIQGSEAQAYNAVVAKFRGPNYLPW